MGLFFQPALRAVRVSSVCLLLGLVAGCGSSRTASAPTSVGTPTVSRNSATGGGAHGSRWTVRDTAAYLASCHSLALRGIVGVTHRQRVKYCAAQLKNAEKYNPQHRNVHGFVGAYSVSGSRMSSATRTTSARPRPASGGVAAIPKGYSGLGALKATFANNNTTQGPSNISGAPRGLAWFPVTATNGRGQVRCTPMPRHHFPLQIRSRCSGLESTRLRTNGRS